MTTTALVPTSLTVWPHMAEPYQTMDITENDNRDFIDGALLTQTTDEDNDGPDALQRWTKFTIAHFHPLKGPWKSPLRTRQNIPTTTPPLHYIEPSMETLPPNSVLDFIHNNSQISRSQKLAIWIHVEGQLYETQGLDYHPYIRVSDTQEILNTLTASENTTIRIGSLIALHNIAVELKTSKTATIIYQAICHTLLEDTDASVRFAATDIIGSLLHANNTIETKEMLSKQNQLVYTPYMIACLQQALNTETNQEVLSLINDILRQLSPETKEYIDDTSINLQLAKKARLVS